MDDSLVFADLRPMLDALLAEHYDANIMPVARVSMDYWSICRFMKKHCQDPYVKVRKLDPRTRKDLRDVLRTRSGQVYEADLELLRNHLTRPGAMQFLFALAYILEKRKIAAKSLKRKQAQS